MRALCCLALFSVFIAGAPRPAASDPFTLNSGQSVEILSVTKGPAARGPALTLKYRTKVPPEDGPALRKEADEIWEHFIVNAERGGHQRAVIRTSAAKSDQTSAAAEPVSFIFEKRDGLWRSLESKARQENRLDKGFVRAFVERIDWAAKHANSHSLHLFMDDDWTMTVADPRWQAPTPVTFGRELALEMGSRILAAGSDHTLDREILAIRISSNRRAARVDSRETDTVTMAGRSVTTVGRSSDYFQLRGDVMLWTKSVTRIEKLVVELALERDPQTSSRPLGPAPVMELRSVP